MSPKNGFKKMNKRPYVLTIAGFDPCSGAGVTSDIKTFEQHEVYGLGVLTSVTYQNESQFNGVKWLSFEEIEKQLESIATSYTPKAIKIGLIESPTVLIQVLDWIKRNWPESFILWDPILKASAGFPFHEQLHLEIQKLVTGNIHLLTPNLPEYALLFGEQSAKAIASQLDCAILIKGGHQTGDSVCDELYIPNASFFRVKSKKVDQDLQKHGTGCMLSASITAEIAKGQSIQLACSNAHFYVKKMIGSNKTLLAYQYNV